SGGTEYGWRRALPVCQHTPLDALNHVVHDVGRSKLLPTPAPPAPQPPRRLEHGEAQHAGLWRALRTAMLAAAWEQRMRREATGAPFHPSAVITAFVEDVRRMVLADWLLATTAVTDMAGTHSSWFPGIPAKSSPQAFEGKWCAGSVIAYVRCPAAGAKPTMEFRLSAPHGGAHGLEELEELEELEAAAVASSAAAAKAAETAATARAARPAKAAGRNGAGGGGGNGGDGG
ncbi:MAG: hypothetical protein J3K34DRAFT_446471, partial [Monoraphidium minutum]